MPLREFYCSTCGVVSEVYHPSTDPELVPAPICCGPRTDSQMIWSAATVDTADTFHPFEYSGPDGRKWHIDNLHKLRAVEHSYLATGHNVRFDAYSADPSNPDVEDGFGPAYNPRDASKPQPPKTLYGFMKG